MAEHTESAYRPPANAPVERDPANEHKRDAQHLNGQNNEAMQHVVHQPTVSQVAQPGFTKLANPGPLGLLSFAITTFVVGLYECGAGYVLLDAKWPRSV